MDEKITIKRPWWNLKKRRLLTQIILHILLIATSVIFFFPFMWMLFTALKTPQELLLGTQSFFPNDPKCENFVTAIESIPFWIYLRNSVTITGLVMLGTIFSSTVAAYAFAKLKWKGRDKWFIVMLATLMIPLQVILIPSYIMYAQIGWLGT